MSTTGAAVLAPPSVCVSAGHELQDTTAVSPLTRITSYVEVCPRFYFMSIVKQPEDAVMRSVWCWRYPSFRGSLASLS